MSIKQSLKDGLAAVGHAIGEAGQAVENFLAPVEKEVVAEAETKVLPLVEQGVETVVKTEEAKVEAAIVAEAPVVEAAAEKAVESEVVSLGVKVAASTLL